MPISEGRLLDTRHLLESRRLKDHLHLLRFCEDFSKTFKNETSTEEFVVSNTTYFFNTFHVFTSILVSKSPMRIHISRSS